MSASPQVVPPPLAASAPAPWAVAVRLLVRWIEHHERADALLEGLPKNMSRAERGRVQHLFFGALRHLGRLDSQIARWVARPPRTRLRAVLVIAGFELIEGGEDGHSARVVHHAVEQAKTLASPSEARLVNAVVRKLADSLASQPVPARGASAEDLADYFSHPLWLVKRWIGAFGAGPTRSLLEFHQRPAVVYARWRDRAVPTPEWLLPVSTPDFYEIAPGHWKDVEPELAAGSLYLQDPATRHAIDLLAPQAGETLFDGCAAPGGKALFMADLMGRGRIVAWDLPGTRLDRLKENLSRARGVETTLVAGDLLVSPKTVLEENGLPLEYTGILLDVPCSNSGVMRHRVDVKWRLQEGDIFKHSRQQSSLLRAAAALVAPGGRLVYSTCSLDSQENEHVVAAFIDSAAGQWRQEAQTIARPWDSGHDGAAAFRLRRSGG